MGVMRHVFNGMKPKGGGAHVTTMGVIGAAATAPFSYMEQKKEHGEAYAAAYAGVEAAGWIFAEPLMWGITLAGAAKGGMKMAVEDAKDNRQARLDIKNKVYEDQGGTMKGTLGGDFTDSEQANTLRQRQMNLLRQHRVATETVLGSEARQLHR